MRLKSRWKPSFRSKKKYKKSTVRLNLEANRTLAHKIRKNGGMKAQYEQSCKQIL